MYIFIYKVCTDMLLKFYTAFTKKVFVVPKYPSPLRPYPFCVCFTVFYILNRQIEWKGQLSASFIDCFFQWQEVNHCKQTRLPVLGRISVQHSTNVEDLRGSPGSLMVRDLHLPVAAAIIPVLQFAWNTKKSLVKLEIFFDWLPFDTGNKLTGKSINIEYIYK